MKLSTLTVTVLALLAQACSTTTKHDLPTRATASAAPISARPTVEIDFEDQRPGEAPVGFRLTLTGDQQPGRWAMVEAINPPSGRLVLAQTDGERVPDRAPLCVYQGATWQNGRASVRFKTVSGKLERTAGLVVRYQHRDAYYLVRADTQQGFVRLYKVIDGRTRPIGGMPIAIRGSDWHTLAVELSGNRIQVFLDDRSLFSANDSTYPDEGWCGVWTKGDSVTWFDDLSITVLDEP